MLHVGAQVVYFKRILITLIVLKLSKQVISNDSKCFLKFLKLWTRH